MESDPFLEYSNIEDPLVILSNWCKNQNSMNCPDGNAMVLSTTDCNDVSSRIVFCKEINDREIYFYTNYDSLKCEQINANKNVSGLFYWYDPVKSKQARIYGVAEKLERNVSDKYWASRPRESKISAWASNQSSKINSRVELIERVKYYTQILQDKDIERPDFWGGMKIIVQRLEIWISQENRLHWRRLYEFNNEKWDHTILCP